MSSAAVMIGALRANIISICKYAVSLKNQTEKKTTNLQCTCLDN